MVNVSSSVNTLCEPTKIATELESVILGKESLASIRSIFLTGGRTCVSKPSPVASCKFISTGPPPLRLSSKIALFTFIVVSHSSLLSFIFLILTLKLIVSLGVWLRSIDCAFRCPVTSSPCVPVIAKIGNLR